MNSSRSLSGAPKVLGRNMDTGSPVIAGQPRRHRSLGDHRTRSAEAVTVQLFDLQWLARSDAGSLLLLFTYSSHRQLFINQIVL